MWVFLSSRIRTWLLLAVALPAARALVHRLSAAAHQRDAAAASSKLLGRADSALTRLSSRTGKRGRRRR